MKLSEVSDLDGKMCAQLINCMKNLKGDFSGADALAFADTVKWVQSLAMQMADILKSQRPVAAAAPAPKPAQAPLKIVKKKGKHAR